MLKSVTLEVVGEERLHCEGCENRVVRLLKSMSGVERARAHASNQLIEVQFDPARVNTASVIERLTSAGYETRLTSAAESQPT